MLMTQKLQQE